MKLSVEKFLKKENCHKILIGLSGGPDSVALLHLILSLQDKLGLKIGIAHIDHGWRKESKEEAEFLKKLANQLQIPFYLHKISSLKGNLENASREERYAFFKTVCQKYDYEAVALAHHSDDQAETVLKRCLEGAQIFSLTGMEKRCVWKNLVIFRPLIGFTKEEILKFLQDNHFVYFLDPTNEDPRFLRAKMRKEIFPYLQKSFSKNIRNPLCQVGASAQEVRDYLEKRVAEAKIYSFTSDFGAYFDLRELKHTVEIKWFIHQFFKEKKLNISHEQLDFAAISLLEKKANCSLEKGFFIDRGYLFYLENKKNCFRSWKIKFEKIKRGDTELLGWKSAFSGNCRAILPDGKYSLGNPEDGCFPLLNKLWNKQKVPAFLRACVPILFDEDGCLVQDFLSGRKLIKNGSKVNELTVSLYRE